MKKILSIGLALLCLSIVALGADTVVTSPNGQIKVTINTADGLYRKWHCPDHWR